MTLPSSAPFTRLRITVHPSPAPLAVQFRVLLFASYADALGAPSVAITLPDGATAGDAVDAVRALAPGAVLPPALVAVNQEYAAPTTALFVGDEVAIIPPVAGG